MSVKDTPLRWVTDEQPVEDGTADVILTLECGHVVSRRSRPGGFPWVRTTPRRVRCGWCRTQPVDQPLPS